MTRDDIIRMAREVADPNTADVVFDDLITLNFGEMERFAALIAAEVGIAQWRRGYTEGQAAEREACAAICDHHDKWGAIPRQAAAAIRARGQP